MKNLGLNPGEGDFFFFFCGVRGSNYIMHCPFLLS